MAGCPRVAGDEEEDDNFDDDFEDEFQIKIHQNNIPDPHQYSVNSSDFV